MIAVLMFGAVVHTVNIAPPIDIHRACKILQKAVDVVGSNGITVNGVDPIEEIKKAMVDLRCEVKP